MLASMMCCQFIFQPGTYDEEFHQLDGVIATYAASMPGFVGNESWVSTDGKRRNEIYYFSDRDSLREFSTVEQHLVAKKKYQNWYDGYQIVISEVTAHYGDGRIDQLLSRSSG